MKVVGRIRAEDSGDVIREKEALEGLTDKEIVKSINSFLKDPYQLGSDAFDLIHAIKHSLKKRNK